MKEDHHRWYIIGKSEKTSRPFSTYALDRVSSLEIKDKRFKAINFDFEKYFTYSFGVTVTDEDPVKVVLSFTPEQGNYLKTLKIHHTQTTLADNETEFRVSVVVRPSYEFYEKILGYGDKVQVISPKSVITEIKKTLKYLTEIYK